MVPVVTADIYYSGKIIEADSCGMKSFDINTRAVYGMKSFDINTRAVYGMKSFDINTRAVYGMRAVGGGYDSLKKTLWPFKYAKTNDRKGS